MIIKRCQDCNNLFSYSEKFRSTFPTYKNIICESCGAEYRIPFFFRLGFAFLLAFPLTLNVVVPGLLFTKMIDILYMLLYDILLLILLPIFIPYEPKAEVNINSRKIKRVLQGTILILIVVFIHYQLAVFITYEDPETVKDEVITHLKEKYGMEFTVETWEKHGVVWYLNADSVDGTKEVFVIWDKFKKPHIQYESN